MSKEEIIIGFLVFILFAIFGFSVISYVSQDEEPQNETNIEPELPAPTYDYNSTHWFNNNNSEVVLNITDGNGTISWIYHGSNQPLTIEGEHLRFSITMWENGSFQVRYVDWYLFIKVGSDEEITVWGVP